MASNYDIDYEEERPRRMRRIGYDHTNIKLANTHQGNNTYNAQKGISKYEYKSEKFGNDAIESEVAIDHQNGAKIMSSQDETLRDRHATTSEKLISSQEDRTTSQKYLTSSGDHEMSSNDVISSENIATTSHKDVTASQENLGSYDERPKRLNKPTRAAQIIQDHDASYSSPPQRLSLHERPQSPAHNTRAQHRDSAIIRRKRGIFEHDHHDLISRLSQSDDSDFAQSQAAKLLKISKKEGKNWENVYVEKLWPIFIVVFKCDLSKSEIKHQKRDSNGAEHFDGDNDNDDDDGKRNQNDGNNADDNMKDGGDCDHGNTYDDDDDQNDMEGAVDDNHGQNNNNSNNNDDDYVIDDHDSNNEFDDDNCDENDEDYLIVHSDDNDDDDSNDDSFEDDDDDDNSKNSFDYDGECNNKVDGVGHIDYDSNNNHRKENLSEKYCIGSDTPGNNLWEKPQDIGNVKNLAGTQVKNNRWTQVGEVNNSVDVSQFDCNDSCQGKQFEKAGESGSCGNHGNQPSFGLVGDNIELSHFNHLNFNTTWTNDTQESGEPSLRGNISQFESSSGVSYPVAMGTGPVATDNKGYMSTTPTTSHDFMFDEDYVDGPGPAISEFDDVYVDEDDVKMTNNGCKQSGTMLVNINQNSNHKAIQKCAQQDTRELANETDLQSKLEASNVMKYDITDINQHNLHSTNEASNDSRCLQNDRKSSDRQSLGSKCLEILNSGTSYADIDSKDNTISVGKHEKMSSSGNNKNNLLVSHLMFNVGPTASGNLVHTSSKTFQSGSQFEAMDVPMYSNEIVVQVSSGDDLSDSDGENFLPSSDMSRLRKVSMGDVRDLADLKDMTQKLKLDHRRPSLVAWKEKNLPKMKSKQKDDGEGSDLRSNNEGQGHKLTSTGSHRSPKSRKKTSNCLLDVDQKKRLLNQKALTPPCPRAFLGDDLHGDVQGRPRSSSFKSPSKYSYDYTATIASTRSLESLQNNERGLERSSSRRSEVGRTSNLLEISENVKPRTGSKTMISSNGSLPSIREEKVDSTGAVRSELERRRKVDDGIVWIKNELENMHSLDCTLAKQLLRLREEIRHLRLQRCYEQQKEMIEDAFDREHAQTLEKSFNMADFELPERLFSPELRHVGLTKMNITARRFSVF